MTGAAIPPAVVADAAAAAKAWLRTAGGDDDAALAGLCASAIGLAEAFCGRALVARAWHDQVAASATWQRLPVQPVTAITAVRDADGATLAAASYAVDIDAHGVGWIRVTDPSRSARIGVDYAAGDAASWDALPPPIAQGIVTLVAHLFDDRDGAATPPATVAALWRPWRQLRLGGGCRA
jgi:uncharacterized phiE125 gp8 family phage protein